MNDTTPNTLSIMPQDSNLNTENIRDSQNYTLVQSLKDAWKVCKHEFLMSRYLVLSSGIILLCIVCLAPFEINGYENKLFVGTIYVLLFFAFIIFAFSYFFSAAISFYQGIFGKNAYLTHSLPISLDAMLFAKIFIFLLWALIGGCEMIFLLWIIKPISWTSMLFEMDIEDLEIVLFAIAQWISTTLFEITYIFMIAALIHRKKTFTMFYGILLYFLIKVALAILFAVIISSLPQLDHLSHARLWFTLVPIILLSILWYGICRVIIKNKLAL
ncbi:hypothetical protein CQA53_08190 [Helicobacter didelphidarum]|uniref:Uncharacterized protein n=1 Tax=Helicobacter didelphidarum TaxID=2040648 RepID=A0A3D8IFU4_9HELI|nr:hypothetical protein [Helicobacter didelphidarum]RDU64049.1 hypothetical protein CQA53_08190 [Helicobacter didelphidarum]